MKALNRIFCDIYSRIMSDTITSFTDEILLPYGVELYALEYLYFHFP